MAVPPFGGYAGTDDHEYQAEEHADPLAGDIVVVGKVAALGHHRAGAVQGEQAEAEEHRGQRQNRSRFPTGAETRFG